MQYTEEGLSQFYHFRKIIGQNIHDIRARRKLSMHRFSSQTGITARALDLYEIGRGDISLIHIVQIAMVLRVEVEKLFVSISNK